MRQFEWKHRARFDLRKEDNEEELEVLYADTKAEHVETLKAEKEKILARIAGPALRPKPIALVQVEWAHKETDRDITTNIGKKKVKTRPERHSSETEIHDIDSSSSLDLRTSIQNLTIAVKTPPTIKITVKQQTYSIF